MLRDVLQRCAGSCLVLLAIVTFTFFLMHAIPGGPFSSEKAIDPATLAALEARYGLDKPLGEQFDASQLDENLLRSSALDGLIVRTLLLQGAEQAGMRFSDTALDQLLLITPEFQQDGRFSPERFDQMIRQMGYSRLQFRQLMQQEWPGNVRELRNFVRRFCVLGMPEPKEILMPASNVVHNAPDLPWKEYMDRQERLYVEQVLRNVNGQVNIACQVMEMSRKSLYDKINKHGIALEVFRGRAERKGQG